MHNLTLRQLRAIRAIHRTGKIINAARELGLTQPAVSLQLREVEAAAGVPLFDRTADGMRPTAAGMAVVGAAQDIEERLRMMADDVGAIAGGRKGPLRLGVVSTAKYFAPTIMARFMRDHPEIEMSLSVGNRAAIIEHLRDHRVDIALMGRPPGEVPVRSALFGQHPLVVVAAPNHPLAKARRISKERIAKEHFLVREPGSGTRVSLDLYLSELPGRIDNLGSEMGSNETIKQAVMAGLGIALISAHTIAQEIEAGRLVVLDAVGLPIRRQWFSVSRADRSMSPVMSAFEDFLQREGAEFLPKVPGT
jgi:LysR family transcriptional regulator, low CO2-responsive transcriptional regulator